jgi:hypothetical protein
MDFLAYLQRNLRLFLIHLFILGIIFFNNYYYIKINRNIIISGYYSEAM